MTRKEANLQILARLFLYISDNPDQRFGQALRNIGVIIDFQDPTLPGEPRWSNHFSEESTSILSRIDKTEKKVKLT